jgi:hypothetical protein
MQICICSVKIFSSCETNILRFSYLTIFSKFKGKTKDPKPEAEERIVTVSK